jgi:hypothetical protein
MAKTYSGDGIILRRKTWWLDCLIHGVRYRRALGKGISRSAALQLSLKYRVEILSGNVGYGRKKKDLLYDDAKARYMAWVETNLKPGTVRSYRECFLKLDESFSGRRLSQIALFDVERHKQARIKAGAKGRAAGCACWGMKRRLSCSRCARSRSRSSSSSASIAACGSRAKPSPSSGETST